MEHLNFRKWLTDQESLDEGLKDRFVAGIKGLGRRLGSAASDIGSSPLNALKGVGQVATGSGQAALGGTQALGNKDFAKDQVSKGGNKILSGIGNVGRGIGKFLRGGAKLAGAVPGAIYDAGKRAGQEELPPEMPPLPPEEAQRKVAKMNHKEMFDLFKKEASGPNKYGKKVRKIYNTFQKHGYNIDADDDGNLVLITPKGERLY